MIRNLTNGGQMSLHRDVPLIATSSITGWDDGSLLHHQDDRPLRRPCTVNRPFGHNESLLLAKLNTSILQVNDEAALENKEKLVIVLVLVPVIFALHDPETDYRIIHLAQRLVVPASLGTRRYQGGDIDHL